MISILVKANNVVSNVVTPNVVGNISTDKLDVNLIGFGEESLPEPTLFKFLQDYFTYSDYSYLINNKGQLDNLETSSYNYLTLSKVNLETNSVIDQPYISLIKPVLSAFNSSDYSYLTIGKNPQEYIGFIESNIFDISKILEDNLIATDDILGSAVLDDDQYNLFDKSLHDITSYDDLVTTQWDIIRDYTDSSSVLEYASLGLDKPFEDSFISISEYTLLLDNTYLETNSITDILTYVWSAQLSLLDTPLVVETVGLTYSKPLTEAKTFSEVVVLGLQDYFAQDFVHPGYIGTSYTV